MDFLFTWKNIKMDEKIENQRFQGSYKTTRGSYKEFNNFWALWFESGSKNTYKITKEKMGDKYFFVIWEAQSHKQIFRIKIK
jgi:hypothetical protein